MNPPFAGIGCRGYKRRLCCFASTGDILSVSVDPSVL